MGSMLITLLRHADRVKIACMAQLVNVIAPIMTSDTGAWRQTIFYPYMLTSVFGRGTVLNTQVLTPIYESKTIFAVNKSLDEDMEVSCDLRQFEGYKIVEHIVLNNDDLQAANTEAQPENVVPVKASAECSKLDGGKLEAVFAKHSWNMIRLAK